MCVQTYYCVCPELSLCEYRLIIACTDLSLCLHRLIIVCIYSRSVEINIAHRLGKFESEKMRPVIVRFMSRQRKIETIKLTRALAKTPYVIKEDLTKDNQEFLNEPY